VAYSHMVGTCMKAAELLARDGIGCEVVDLRTLVPMDMETVVASVRKTHRAVVTQEEWRNAGIAAEIASRLYEAAFDDLDAPVERVGGADVPMPYARNLERAAIPGEQDVAAAARRAVA